MLVNPFDSKYVRGLGFKSVNPTGKISDAAKFQPLLDQVKLDMLKVFSNSSSVSKNSGFNFNPFQSHKMILNWMAVQQSAKTGDLVSPSLKNKVSQLYSNSDIFSGESNNSLLGNTPQKIRDLVGKTAQNHGIPQTLFNKLIGLESSFNPFAKSSKGAMGLGQLMPETAKELNLDIDKPHGHGSVWDPESNLDASARYLRRLYSNYERRGFDQRELWKFAAGAYNAGIGNIQKAIQKIDGERSPTWEQVASVLPQITGSSSQETIRYVDRLSS